MYEYALLTDRRAGEEILGQIFVHTTRLSALEGC